MCQPFNISPSINIRLPSCYHTDPHIYLLICMQNFNCLPLETWFLCQVLLSLCISAPTFLWKKVVWEQEIWKQFPNIWVAVVYPSFDITSLPFQTCRKKSQQQKSTENKSSICLNCIYHFDLESHFKYVDYFISDSLNKHSIAPIILISNLFL